MLKYKSGQLVEMGDKVKLGGGMTGEVTCIIEEDKFTDIYNRDTWGYLKKGFIVNSPEAGDIHFENAADYEIELDRRA